jgi:hypothetical protein
VKLPFLCIQTNKYDYLNKIIFLTEENSPAFDREKLKTEILKFADICFQHLIINRHSNFPHWIKQIFIMPAVDK